MQIVVLMPALFLLMFIGMQAALIYHGRTVAIAAAEEGARAAAARHGSAGDGQAAATAFIASAGGDGVLRRCHRHQQPHRHDAPPSRSPGRPCPWSPGGHRRISQSVVRAGRETHP